MSMDDVEERVGSLLGTIGTLGAVVKFELKDEGVLRIDATSSPAVVSREDGPADTSIRISSDNLLKLMDGNMDPMVAFAMGKIKVEGSKGLAMKLTSLLK